MLGLLYNPDTSTDTYFWWGQGLSSHESQPSTASSRITSVERSVCFDEQMEITKKRKLGDRSYLSARYVMLASHTCSKVISDIRDEVIRYSHSDPFFKPAVEDSNDHNVLQPTTSLTHLGAHHGAGCLFIQTPAWIGYFTYQPRSGGIAIIGMGILVPR